MLLSPDKLIVKLLPLSECPSKSYALSMLLAHIQTVQPATSLDAGCGDLRNRWMFPGEYVGITLSKKWYFEGLKRRGNEGLKSTVYAMRLEGDFSFMGSFDLCVCTYAIGGVKHPLGFLRRLSGRVKRGGTLIFNAGIELWPSGLERIQAEYKFIDVVFVGLPEHSDNVPFGELHSSLMHKEMIAPNTPEGHSTFYVFAHEKITDHAAAEPPPTIVYDSSLAIVEKDIPFLLMD